ncbi:hypothetical protein SBF1_1280002 [Candidatus Desulfosporosinus infrequens]|uniref:Uncharacterized protein n=1 Tax=Candidatus Desulfosporosinus infrequens TaxID=2043169 RepID=A0A2U3K3A6_9FIRM|nr:hypothetical protein SBF1_1280002 [Candidatus Desulfosporosinus infrequens]
MKFNSIMRAKKAKKFVKKQSNEQDIRQLRRITLRLERVVSKILKLTCLS